MIRRLAALAAAFGVTAAVLVAGAAPAQAACPTALTIPHDVTWGSQYVGTDTRVVRCDNGTSGTGDDYYRLQWWAYTDSSDIRRTFGYNSTGNPVMQWQSDNGNLANRINGYPEWRVGGVDFVELGNQPCYTPCYFTVLGRADRVASLDTNFQYSAWR
jgi:hypothetical protein